MTIFKSAQEVYVYVYEHGVTSIPKEWNITSNFTWKEAFTNEVLSDGYPILEVFKNVEALAKILQSARTKIGKPFVVHCWVRQIPHNKRAGSTAKLGMHLNGSAVDFHIEGMTCAAGRQAILNLGLKLRIEDGTSTWIHVDTGNSYINDYNYGLFKA